MSQHIILPQWNNYWRPGCKVLQYILDCSFDGPTPLHRWVDLPRRLGLEPWRRCPSRPAWSHPRCWWGGSTWTAWDRKTQPFWWGGCLDKVGGNLNNFCCSNEGENKVLNSLFANNFNQRAWRCSLGLVSNCYDVCFYTATFEHQINTPSTVWLQYLSKYWPPIFHQSKPLKDTPSSLIALEAL